MKFKRINKTIHSEYNLDTVIDRVNEIIDFLNNSFLTLDKDTAIVDSLTTVSSCVNYNEKQIERCPNCGDSHFTVFDSVSTCVYYPPIIKNGENINPDRNTRTYSVKCLQCGHIWDISK